MFDAFQNRLDATWPFLKEKKLLLAVSGGVDSMVMADLFRQMNCTISIAHCNFNLRGSESDDDQIFVQSYADKYTIPFHSTRFDTISFASDNKLSIQIAARRLRYVWFDELIESNGFDFVLTAHHADDNFETFLINLSRGTGLDGLTGIPMQNGKILRPLLDFSKKEIEDYAAEKNLQWREDSSNSSDKYLRNQLRHGVVPILKNLNPNFLDSFSQTLQHLKQSQSLVRDAALLVYKQVAIEKEDQVIFKIFELKRLDNYRAYLYQWFKDFGFTAWDDVYALVDAASGKQILSQDFRLLKDREVLILSPISSDDDSLVVEIDKQTAEITSPINLSFSETDAIHQAGDNRIFVDADRLEYPLLLRRWREGDYFQPFGMDGKKKVSKYFKDQKFSLIDKSNTWILSSGGEIVWIVGHRPDDRFKVTNKTKHILQITAS